MPYFPPLNTKKTTIFYGVLYILPEVPTQMGLFVKCLAEQDSDKMSMAKKCLQVERCTCMNRFCHEINSLFPNNNSQQTEKAGIYKTTKLAV